MEYNPPAFPTNDSYIRGMTLRDYFAAHAPAVPEWFEPVLPDKPTVRARPSEKWNKFSSDPNAIIFNKYYDDENGEWYAEEGAEIPEAFKIEVAEYIKGFNKEFDEREAWKKLKETAFIIQWRWYYADLMLQMRRNESQ